MSDIKKCPHCGKKLHSNALYCMFCMTSLEPKKDITPHVRKHRKWMLFCALPLVAILLIVIFLTNCTPRTINGEYGGSTLGENNIMDVEDAGQTAEDLRPTQNSEGAPACSGEEKTDPINNPGESALPETPVQTKPETQNPQDQVTTEATLPSSVCYHSYISASCIAPMTCEKCGDTVGEANTSLHIWKPITAVIHHKEVGHYENVNVSYKTTVYLCFFCGYNQDGYASMDALREHISVHSNSSNYEMIISYPDMLADTREVWKTKTEQQWIVDEEAYDETVTVGYVCTVCNRQKEL